MLEEIGQPYHTELLDYDTTMKAAVYLAIQSGCVGSPFSLGSPFSQGVDIASFVLVHHTFGKTMLEHKPGPLLPPSGNGP
jgi:hypothetical protein